VQILAYSNIKNSWLLITVWRYCWCFPFSVEFFGKTVYSELNMMID